MKWWQEVIVWVILGVVAFVAYEALMGVLPFDSEQKHWLNAAIACAVVLGVVAWQRRRGR
jgi:hypothetical protein